MRSSASLLVRRHARLRIGSGYSDWRRGKWRSVDQRLASSRSSSSSFRADEPIGYFAVEDEDAPKRYPECDYCDAESNPTSPPPPFEEEPWHAFYSGLAPENADDDEDPDEPPERIPMAALDDTDDASSSGPTLEAVFVDKAPETLPTKADPAAKRIEQLLDLNRYPIGLSNTTTSSPSSSSSWTRSMLKVLATVQDPSLAFRLLDRWQMETINWNTSDQTNAAIPVASIWRILRHWREEVRTAWQHGTTERLSPEHVWDTVQSYHTSGMIVDDEESGIDRYETDDRIQALIISAFRRAPQMDGRTDEDDPLRLARRAQTLFDTADCDGLQRRQASMCQLLLIWFDQMHRSANDEIVARAVRAQIQRLLDAAQQRTEDYGVVHHNPRWTAVQLALAFKEGKDAEAAAQYAERVLAQLAADDATTGSTYDDEQAASFLLYGWIVTAVAQTGRVERAVEIWRHWLPEQPTSSAARSSSRHLLDADQRDDDDLIRPNPVAAILDQYRRRIDKQPDVALRQLESFWQEMEDYAVNTNRLEIAQPNLDCYQIRVAAYSRAGKPERAEQLVRQYMLRFHGNDSSTLTTAERDSVVALWNAVLEAYVDRGGSMARRNCARIVSLLRRDRFDAKGRLAPTARTFLLYLRCICNQLHAAPMQQAETAQKILGQIGDLADEKAYFAVMGAWAKADRPYFADELLQALIDNPVMAPSTEHFLLVMKAWANWVRTKQSHEALQRIQELVEVIEKSNLDQGVKPAKSLAAVNVYVDALSHCTNDETPDLAEQILQSVLSDRELQPDPVLCANILAAWMRSPRVDSPQRATALFQHLREQHSTEVPLLNGYAYNTLMKIYSEHHLPGRAKLLLREMKESDDPRLRPTIDSYMVLLEAFGRTGRFADATSLLNELIHEHQEGSLVGATNSNVQFTPVFNSVIRAWMNSDATNAVEKIAETLTHMEKLTVAGSLDARPDRLSFNMGIHAASLRENVTPEDAALAWKWYQAVLDRLYRTGDRNFRPDLYLFRDIIEVLVECGQSDHLCTLLEDMKRLMHPKSWYDKDVIGLLRQIGELFGRVESKEMKQNLLREFYSVGRRNRKDFDDILHEVAMSIPYDAIV